MADDEPRTYGDKLRELIAKLSPMRVVASPYVPEGQMLVMTDPGPVFNYFPDVKISEPLWDEVKPERFRFSDDGEIRPNPFAEEVAAARRFLQASHERIFDGLCNDLGLDPETTWREPRRAALRELNYRRNRMAYQMEARVAMSVLRPESYAVVTFTP